ncbi:MAG: hypothetical protein K2X55_20810 [Burkholderiaceae bacterium]|nr:hypothetical protein [Burkholderiaceae bacterium]
MLFPRHPKPVVSQKAVATQVVQQRLQDKAVDKHLLIVEQPASPTPPVPPVPPAPPKD